MMEVITEVLDVFATYIELMLSIVVGYCFLEKTRELRELYKQIMLLPLIPTVGVTIIDLFAGRYSGWRMLYSIASICILLGYIYRDRWYKNLAVTMAYFGMFMFGDVMVTSLVSIKMGRTMPEILTEHAEIYLVCLLMSKMVLIVLVEFVMQLKWRSLFNSRKYWNLYLFITAGMFGMMNWATATIIHYSDNVPLTHMGIAMFTFAIMFMIGIEISISKISMQEQDELEIQLLSSYNQTLAKALQEQQYKTENERKLRHDFKNIVIGMQACLNRGDTDELQTIIDQMMSVIKTSKGVKIPNTKLAELLTQKMFEAEQEKISFSVNVDFPEKTKISMLDICVMLGNLLDNAIENTRDASVPKISVVIKHVKSYYIIRITNTYACKPCREKDRFISHKTQGYHGIGIKSAQEVVIKHGGTFHADFDEQNFYAEIMLPENEV